MPTEPARAWQRMLSGRRLNLVDPSPLDVEIEDIAHGLSYVARWNGQTRGDYPYSVAAHSLLVEEIFSRRHPHIGANWQLAALLHDAAEYVTGDMITPAKAALGKDFGALEARIQGAVHKRFSLPTDIPHPIKKEIKSADLAAAFLEARDLAGFTAKELKSYFRAPREREILNMTPNPIDAQMTRAAFLDRFHALESMRTNC